MFQHNQAMVPILAHTLPEVTTQIQEVACLATESPLAVFASINHAGDNNTGGTVGFAGEF